MFSDPLSFLGGSLSPVGLIMYHIFAAMLDTAHVPTRNATHRPLDRE